MDKKQAQEIIKDTFENPFDKYSFIGFIKNLLNSIEDATFIYQGNYIPDAYKPYIKALERVGKYNDGENLIDILIITLRKETSLERARAMQRNFIAWYLDGSRGDIKKNAALAAYLSPNESDWRFSLVKMDYKLGKTKKGDIKVIEEVTPARRWSFLVGANEKSHTAQSRLVDILANDEVDPTLEELENAFNIETVTEEFFIEYRNLFIKTREALDKVMISDPKVKADFHNQGIDTVNFAKKLLGQIIFLYFLQKKGWFGVGRDDNWGCGPKDFLRHLFKKKYGEYDNFFNNILEPLFYEALRIDRRHDDDYYSRFNCKIPFLNGGLFDPIGNYDWVHTDIRLPNELFSNNNKSNKGDIGDGILDIFDRYNFTVREDEPLEREVAIDPELLGKAYEKFNAIRPDNFDEFLKTLKSGQKGEENRFNKKFGVYYTPREIVHYMCQQSLINYLATELEEIISKDDLEILIIKGEQLSENEQIALIKQQRIQAGEQKSSNYKPKLPQSIHDNAKLIDKKLEKITVCDPAVGSGAFLVGMMNEIVRARRVLSIIIKNNKSDYEFKRQCIEYSLYGVDIDPGAVEIAKLRLWLSLVVDEEDINNVKPLPNLDYRIMQGNSLVSEFMGINFDFNSQSNNIASMFNNEMDELIESYRKKKEEFLNESNVSRKAIIKEEIEQLIIEIFETKLETHNKNDSIWQKYIEQKYSVLTNEKQKNDLIEQEKGKLYKELDFDPETAETQLRDYTSGKRLKPLFLWDLFFSEVFHEKGGFDVVIGNPPYIQLQKLRGNPIQQVYKNQKFRVYDSTGDIYCLFYEKGINILKRNGHLVFITSNKWMRAGYGEKLRKYFLNYNPEILIDLGPGVFKSATVDTNILVIEKADNIKNTLACNIYKTNHETKDIALYLKSDGVTLSNLTHNAWFIGNAAEMSLKEKIERIGKPIKNWDVNIYYGIKTGYNEAFIIDTATKERLCAEDPKSAEIIKPILRGRDIKRYSYEWAGLWLIASGFDLDVPKLYPVVYKHLLQFEEKAKKRYDQGKNWWNLRACDYYPEFEKEKLVWQEMAQEPTFSYDKQYIFCNDTGRILTGNYIKLFVGIFNSLFFKFVFSNYYAGGGLGKKGVRYKSEFMKNIPIPLITSNNHAIVDKIENLVDEIIIAKKQTSSVDTSYLEKEINQLVYQLYDLTPEEIKIIEDDNM